MRVSGVVGTNGAGKTTLIRRMIEHFKTRGKTSAVILNEQGQARYDQDFVAAHGAAVEGLRGG